MEDRNAWKRTLHAALGCLALTLGMTGSLNAEMLPCSAAAGENTEADATASGRWCFEPMSTVPAQVAGKEIENAVTLDWEQEWEGLRRSVLESMMSMILIRWGTPPPIPQGNNQEPNPPGQDNGGGENPPPPPPPPPPPEGGGENPPGDGPVDPPPPQGTPEPSSLLIAGIGVSLTSLVAWRRRRNRK